jgi:hypothetical protein
MLSSCLCAAGAPALRFLAGADAAGWLGMVSAACCGSPKAVVLSAGTAAGTAVRGARTGSAASCTPDAAAATADAAAASASFPGLALARLAGGAVVSCCAAGFSLTARDGCCLVWAFAFSACLASLACALSCFFAADASACFWALSASFWARSSRICFYVSCCRQTAFTLPRCTS